MRPVLIAFNVKLLQSGYELDREKKSRRVLTACFCTW